VDRVRLKALAIGGCLSLLAAATSFVPIVWSWEEGIDLHVLFRARGARAAPNNVVLVPIDRKAARSLFLPQSAEDFERCHDVRLDQALPGYRNPDPPDVLTRWPRCLHARALQALALARPEVVVMDISFRPRNDPGGVFSEQDRQLAAAMRNVGKVVLALKIRSQRNGGERAQPIATDIEAAATARAPFLLLGEQLQRADKYCLFKEDGDWTGPCLPTIAYQLTSRAVYPQLRDLLQRSASENVDLIPAHADALLADGALQPSVMLIRHVATSDRETLGRVRALLASERATHSAASHQQLRGLIDIYLGAGIRYFNFYGSPGAFATLRYERLAAGPEASHPAPGSLRGKAVFIGFAEYEQPEASEHFSTPYTTDASIKLSGVELAATAYANLLDGSSIVTAARWQRALVALSLGALCALLFATASLPLAALMCALLWISYLGAALSLFEHYALWLPLLVPLGVSIPVTAGTGLYLEIKRQRDRSRHALGALLPGRLVDRIINRNEELTQLRESVYGTCVFTDMQRYTTLFKDHSPDEVARILDTYFQALFPVVQKVGGETIDVLGDAMLAVWTGRDPDPVLRERACMAALQLAEAAERFRETRSDVSIRTRIGVDFGRMTLGMFGSPLHLEYRPVGEPPNIAARLQELGKRLGTPLLVSEPVIAGLERFVVRDLGLFMLREVPHPTRVYGLIGERAGVTSKTLDLCAAFAGALADYQAGRHVDAQSNFEGLLRDHPGDGPSLFYMALCAKGRFYGATPIRIADEPHAQ
jgi:adenylate cyclase